MHIILNMLPESSSTKLSIKLIQVQGQKKILKFQVMVILMKMLYCKLKDNKKNEVYIYINVI